MKKYILPLILSFFICFSSFGKKPKLKHKRHINGVLRCVSKLTYKKKGGLKSMDLGVSYLLQLQKIKDDKQELKKLKRECRDQYRGSKKIKVNPRVWNEKVQSVFQNSEYPESVRKTLSGMARPYHLASCYQTATSFGLGFNFAIGAGAGIGVCKSLGGKLFSILSAEFGLGNDFYGLHATQRFEVVRLKEDFYSGKVTYESLKTGGALGLSFMIGSDEGPTTGIGLGVGLGYFYAELSLGKKFKLLPLGHDFRKVRKELFQ